VSLAVHNHITQLYDADSLFIETMHAVAVVFWHPDPVDIEVTERWWRVPARILLLAASRTIRDVRSW
jgi:hypothetical protein